MKALSVVSWQEGKKVGQAELDPRVFNGEVSKALVHESVWSYGQNRRVYTASTRTRSEVSGGGKKPWKQKGTGRARSSSIRAPHWKGGGTIFGPRPKIVRYTLPRKARLEALRSALNQSALDQRLVIVDNLALTEAKTKRLAQGLARVGAEHRPLVVTSERDIKLERAGRNIPGFDARTALNVTAEDIALHGSCVLVKDALKLVSERLKRTIDKREKTNDDE